MTNENTELTTVVSVVNFVFDRFQAYIGYCNAHPVLWIPVGFGIASLTIKLFRSAIGIGNNNLY